MPVSLVTGDRMAVVDDGYRSQVAAYCLGALEGPELAAFREHLGGCAGCNAELDAYRAAADALPRALSSISLRPQVREQLLDLCEAPPLPWDLESRSWIEAAPGVRLSVFREDPERGVRACLVWARPGARHPVHRHLGDELLLVLQGALRDERGTYGPGQICRSLTGSIHSEEALPGEDCLCFAVYYGGIEPVVT